MLANVFALAASLPAVMGWHVSRAARHVYGMALAQAGAWASFLLAKPIHDRLFSTVWIALLGLSFVFMWKALRGWLGPRPGGRLIAAAAGLTPLGYNLGFGSYAFRSGWSNYGLALMMLCVCAACIAPAPHAGRRWRALIVLCLGALAAVTVGRGTLAAFFTELYPTLRSPHPMNLAGAVLNHIAITLTTISMLVGWHEEAERALRVQADTDALTGLLNRRAWRERADDMMAVARRYAEPLAVLMIDMDHFKQINDTAGHAAGDRALQAMAQVLQDEARRGDLVCRYGGEEFCVMLRRATAADVQQVDRRLRTALAAGATGRRGLDFSSGWAVLRADDTGLDSLLSRADMALYDAKAAGRGQLMPALALG